jgi:segregation and condensation protein B
MELSVIIPHIEALVFASEKPVTTMDLVELINNALGFMEDRANLDQVETALDAISEKYKSEFYAFHLVQSGGGWQFLTKKQYHATVAQLNGQKFLKRLSAAALETLSIIAYKQPITKGEIENIRGVNCDYAVQKLLEKELIIIIGRKEDAPGQPLVYTTSKTFMDYFGINSSADLPQLSDITNQEPISPTVIGQSNPAESDLPENIEMSLAVNELGEIIMASEPLTEPENILYQPEGANTDVDGEQSITFQNNQDLPDTRQEDNNTDGDESKKDQE